MPDYTIRALPSGENPHWEEQLAGRMAAWAASTPDIPPDIGQMVRLAGARQFCRGLGGDQSRTRRLCPGNGVGASAGRRCGIAWVEPRYSCRLRMGRVRQWRRCPGTGLQRHLSRR